VCTFQPNVAPSHDAVPQSGLGEEPSAHEPATVRSAVSVSRWVHKQKAGRDLQRQRTEVPHATGKTWSRAPTRPAEFKFATDAARSPEARAALRSGIRSLQQVRPRAVAGLQASVGARRRAEVPVRIARHPMRVHASRHSALPMRPTCPTLPRPLPPPRAQPVSLTLASDASSPAMLAGPKSPGKGGEPLLTLAQPRTPGHARSAAR